MEAPAARPVAKPATGVSKGGKQTRTTLLDLNEKVCKWPIGHPDDADFHFCGRPSNAGFPYCNDHCLVAYQALRAGETVNAGRAPPVAGRCRPVPVRGRPRCFAPLPPALPRFTFA
jgi:hypothetical protein